MSDADADRELSRLWRVWKTAREMCRDRGYELLEEEINLSRDEFKSRYGLPNGLPDRNSMNFSARPTEAMLKKYTDPPTAKSPNPQPTVGTVWVEFCADQSVGIKQLRTFAHHITGNNFQTGIFITSSAVTPSALKIVPTILPTVLEVFNEQDLLVNITKHELVPQHIVLSKEEKNALLARYRVKESQLPRIQVGDPVAK
jgi:DNA-directed RNA polymerase I, II, and III subunit RPABC1